MKSKFNFLSLLLILCFLLSISSVAASDDLAVDDALDSPQDDIAISEISEGIGSDDMGLAEKSSNTANSNENSGTALADGSTYSFSDLADLISSHSEGNLTIEGTYKYDESKDSAYKGGIIINNDKQIADGKEVTNGDYNLTIIGKNCVIDGSELARAFNIGGSGNIVLSDINFTDCCFEECGGAIYSTASNLTMRNINFLNCSDKNGTSIHNDKGSIYLHWDVRYYSGGISNLKGNLSGYVNVYDGTFVNIGGYCNLTNPYLGYSNWDMPGSNRFSNIGGTILMYSGGSMYNVTALNENGLIDTHNSTIFITVGNFTNKNANISCSISLKNCNLTNDHGNIDFDYLYSTNDGIENEYNLINNIEGNISTLRGTNCNTSFINDHGDCRFGKFYIEDYYDNERISYGTVNFNDCNLTNIKGKIFHLGQMNNYSIVNDHGNLKLGSGYIYTNSSGNLTYSYSTAQYDTGNFTNLGGYVDSIGTLYLTNLKNEDNGTIKFGEAVLKNGSNELVYAYSFLLRDSNLTNDNGNFTYCGSIINSSLVNNESGDMNFVMYQYIQIVQNAYGGNRYWDVGESPVHCEYVNLTNLGGHVYSEGGSFNYFNIVNDKGHMDFRGLNNVLETPDGLKASYTYPFFDVGNLTNVCGKFISQGTKFRNTTLINDDGEIDMKTLYSKLYSKDVCYDIHNIPYFNYCNITNSGNISAELEDLIGNNIKNNGTFIGVSSRTYDNTFINDGIFSIRTLYDNDTNHRYDSNFIFNNNFQNYGNFSVNGNVSGSYRYYYHPVNSTLVNYGDFVFDGDNGTANLINYTILNNAAINLSQINSTNLSLDGNGTVNLKGTNVIGVANITGGNIVNHGGRFTLGEAPTRVINATVINDNAYLNISSAYFESCDVVNMGGMMDVNLGMTGGNLTNVNGTFISHNGRYFDRINVINDGGDFRMLGENETVVDMEGETVHLRHNSILTDSIISNNGNMELEATLRSSNITNDGNFTANGTYTSYNNIINNGNFNLTTREDDDSNYFEACNITNNGNFTISKNCYNNHDDVTNIDNRGHFEFNGLNGTKIVDNTNISNYGDLDLINSSVFGGNITNLGGTVNVLNSVVKDNQSFNNSKGIVNSKNSVFECDISNGGIINSEASRFEGNINGDGVINSANDTFNGANLTIGKNGSLNLTEGQLIDVAIESNGSVLLNGESLVNNSKINGGKLTNYGNADLIDSNLSDVDLTNDGNMSLSGCDVSGSRMANGGNMSLSGCDVSGSRIANDGNLDVNGGSVSDSDVVNNGHISAKDSNIAAALSNKDSIFGKDISSYYGSGVQFSAVFTDDLGNKISRKTVSFAVNGRIYKAVTDSNGLAKLNVQLAIGKYTVQAINPVTAKTKSFTFTVTKIPTKLNAKKVVENYGARKYLVIKVADPKGKAVNGVKLTVKFNKRTYTLTTKKGVAKCRLPVLKVGNYNAAISSKDAKYAVSGKVAIKVNKAKTSVKAPKITAKAKQSKYFKVTVKSKVTKKAAKNIRIKIKVYTGKKAKVYKLKTNKKGLAKFNVKGLKKGSHKVVISSLNKNYKISKKSKILIK